MGDDFGAVEEDVPFDWSGADRLITQFRAAATTIENQRSGRRAAGDHALVDWQGPHSDQFVQRQATGDADAQEIASSLRRSATQVEELKSAAEEEQKRRELAREYMRAKEENDRNESVGNKIMDGLTGEDFKMPPKPPPRKEAPLLTAPEGAAGARQ